MVTIIAFCVKGLNRFFLFPFLLMKNVITSKVNVSFARITLSKQRADRKTETTEKHERTHTHTMVTRGPRARSTAIAAKALDAFGGVLKKSHKKGMGVKEMRRKAVERCVSAPNHVGADVVLVHNGPTVYIGCPVDHAVHLLLGTLDAFRVKKRAFTVRMMDDASRCENERGTCGPDEDNTLIHLESCADASNALKVFDTFAETVRSISPMWRNRLKELEYSRFQNGVFMPVRKFVFHDMGCDWCLDMRYFGPQDYRNSDFVATSGEMVASLYEIDVRNMQYVYASRCMLSEYYRLTAMLGK